MNKTKLFLGLGILALIVLFSGICTNCTRASKKETSNSSRKDTTLDSPSFYRYNFYIENSGSVKGYFNGKSNDAGIIFTEFYDRIDESKNEGDTITLNYINNEIKPQKCSLETWLNETYVNCNAQYSDLDKVLEQILDKTDNQTVNFVMSDYCFVSKYSDLKKAQSAITKIFTKSLKHNSDISIAIYKYDASFDGYYFPGKIKYSGKRPLYLWIFGPNKALKKISQLKTEHEIEDRMFLQCSSNLLTKVKTNNARMTNSDRDCVVIKEWDADRRQANLYKINLEISVDNILLNEFQIANVHNYNITPKDYSIEKISKINEGKYLFTISTKHPSPCTININYPIDIPSWVNDSNFNSYSLPKYGTTFGIKYLIGGVVAAYTNKSNNIFDINLTLK